MNRGQALDFHGQCSWIPSSRTKSAPRNDCIAAFFRTLLSDANWSPRSASAAGGTCILEATPILNNRRTLKLNAMMPCKTLG
jgi:hypothetical protein